MQTRHLTFKIWHVYKLPVCHDYLPRKWTEKNMPDTFIICFKALSCCGDQIAIYMLQHFDIHVAKLVRIAERKKY